MDDSASCLSRGVSPINPPLAIPLRSADSTDPASDGAPTDRTAERDSDRRRPARIFRDAGRALLLAGIAALVWIVHFDRWSPASWQLPTDYYVDAHETLARLKAASEGDIVPLQPQIVSRLGAPFGADWNDYPTPDKPLMLFLGGLARVVGVFAAANLGLLLAQVTAALAFYAVARWFRCRWEWAAAGALLFAFTYQTFHRGLAHFSLIYTWTVPAGLLAVWLVARSRRLAWHRPAAWFCLVIAAALGVSNPYNLFFWLQLMGWALLFQLGGDRRRPNLQVGAAAMAVAAVAFGFAHAEVWLHAEDTGALPLLARNYGGTERYALKVVELFIPPAYHRWDAFAAFGHRYTRWSEWRGEAFLPYLGLAGIAGLGWIGWIALRRIAARRPLPGQALPILWIVLYAMVGGLTNVLAFFAEFQVFRATNRAAIFIVAIVLLFLVIRLARTTRRWPRPLQAAAAALLAAVGVAEQLPHPDPASDRQAIARMVEEDRAFGAALEAAVPAQATVFQLPVLGFPEVATPHQLNDYEHVRPYLTTRDLRFSYGAPKDRARGHWQHEFAGLPAPELVRQLEQHGFAAVHLNRKGYGDRGEQLLAELARAGRARRIEIPGGDHVAILLEPEANARAPMAQACTLGRGWQIRPDHGVRWTNSDGALSFYNPHPHPVRSDLDFHLVAVAPRDVMLTHEGRPVAHGRIDTAPAVLSVRDFHLHPGVNRFTLHSDAPPIRLGQGANQLRSFGLQASSVVVTGPTLTPKSAKLAGSEE